VIDLKAIYLTSLTRAAPRELVQRAIVAGLPRNVITIGKCAGPLLDGVAAAMEIDHAFAALPEGYPPPQTQRVQPEIAIGGHPHMTGASFEAGRRLLRFVDEHDNLLFLVSGGGSACVEVPLAPYSEAEVSAQNARLIASGLPIATINAARSELSAIKGGKLGQRVRGCCVTLVYSDVATGRLADVASGPTARSELTLIADNSTLVRIAADCVRETGARPIALDEQIECDVATAARLLFERARELRPGEVLVAGGEPTVKVRGPGKGGRCSELALRFAMLAGAASDSPPDLQSLFASSDGVDGSSGAAGILLRKFPAIGDAEGALERSASWPIVSQLGEPIMIAPTGNNLRDLFFVARG
jgi:glycerate 2-kinase